MRSRLAFSLGILALTVGCARSEPAGGPGGLWTPPPTSEVIAAAPVVVEPTAAPTPDPTPTTVPTQAANAAPMTPPTPAPSPTPVLTPTPAPGPTEAPTSAGTSACTSAPAGTTPARVVRSGSRSQKVVALTFDDGYNATRTLQILRILQAAHVNATFFPITYAVRASPDTWQSVAAAGYPIANHTYDHARLAGRCYATQLAELTRWTSSLKRLGIDPLAVMRPPGGAYDITTRLAATGAGEQAVVLWDVDTQDWAKPSSATIAARALAGREGSIVLMHTSVANTVTALPRIIDGYRARGFSFVTIGQLLGVEGAVPF